MFNLAAGLRATLVAVSLLPLSTLSHAQSQTQVASETSVEIVQFAGAMHETALICEAYSEQRLLDYKREQKKTLAGQGMAEETFETAFSRGRQQAEQRWESLSDVEKQQACIEIENQTADMTPPAE